MLTSFTQLQTRSFHVVERTRTSSKCQKMKNARVKRAKILFFIVKYANLWGFLLPSSSWLLKLPIFFTNDAAKKFFPPSERNSPSVFPYLVKLNDNSSYDGLREPIRKLENHYHELQIYYIYIYIYKLHER